MEKHFFQGSGLPGSTPNLPVLAAAIAITAIASAFAPSRPSAAEGSRGRILYVDDDAPATDDGSTWKNAYKRLQDALDAAREPGASVTEIRVAGGVYKPDQGSNVLLGDIQASFELIGGTALRGGYAGYYTSDPAALTPTGAHDPDARDFEKFETLLSGDLQGNDAPNWQNMEDNSRNVVTVQNAEGVLIEGVVVASGRASGDTSENGAGVLALHSSLKVLSCVVRDCRASSLGGGAYSLECELMIGGCQFIHNLSTYGGGAFLDEGVLAVDNTLFEANRAGTQWSGGLDISSSTVQPRVTRCTFRSNFAGTGAGGAAGGAKWEDCVFEDNVSADRYAAASISGLIARCVFRNNSASFEGGGAAIAGTGTNWIIDCTFERNWQGFDGGGGVIVIGSGTHHFINCSFLGNTGTGNGPGGGACIRQGTSTFNNCVFAGNDSGNGGAVFINEPSGFAQFVGCTFFGNHASQSPAGGIAGRFIGRNCIFWNSTPTHFGVGAQPDVAYSCVEGEFQGEGILTADPMFANPLGDDGLLGTSDDDYRLDRDSPCIDAGNTSFLPLDDQDVDDDGDVQELLPLDLEGAARLRNAPMVPESGVAKPCNTIVDMGPHEFQPSALKGDSNGDMSVDVDDLILIILSWGVCQSSSCPDACPADVAPVGCGDDTVDVDDLLVVLLNWS